MAALYVALMHGEVVGKTGEDITSSLTHFDVHDIARSCRTYGVTRYFVVTPLETMRYLAQRMISYWRSGLGNHSIPNRAEALELVEVVTTLDEVVAAIESRHGVRPCLVATSARARERRVSYEALRRRTREEDRPILLIFGTAYGLNERVMGSCDEILPPIRAGEWNHLSVRSAVAIILDRVVGEAQG